MIPLVSIACITYKHQNYIEDAILSFLKQKTNFDFEILICDDASPDKTEDIVDKFLNKNYSNIKIKYFRHKENIGPQRNFLFCVNNCIGKYIAFCDGDDYWTDETKLQKQFDFLENNSEYNLCYHGVKILEKNIQLTDDFIYKTNKDVTNVFDLAVWGNYVHTCSVFLRNNCSSINNYPAEYLCDYFLYIHAVNSGKIKKISTIMSVYRYGDGVWASTTCKKKYKFLVDNIHNILITIGDDTIREIMKLRLNSVALYSLPKYITKIENTEDRTYEFQLNERIPVSILINIFIKKIKLKLKNIKFL